MLCRKDSSAKVRNRCNRDIGRPHQRRLGSQRNLTTAGENKQFIRMVIDNRFISAARLCVEMIQRFLRRLPVQSTLNRFLAAGYWFRRPARCPSLTLDHKRCRHVWGRTHRRLNLRHWSKCVFSEQFCFIVKLGCQGSSQYQDTDSLRHPPQHTHTNHHLLLKFCVIN